jgi:hypothetical protein
MRQIKTYILVKKNSFFKTFFPYFWSLNSVQKKQFARFYSQLREFTRNCMNLHHYKNEEHVGSRAQS